MVQLWSAMSKRVSSTVGLLAVLCGSLVALGCRLDPDEPEATAPCAGAVTISVDTSEPQPRFRWTPACLVTTVVVATSPARGEPAEHWRIEADKEIVGPPVTYGTLPTGAQSSGYMPLTSNQDYRVSVFIPNHPLPIGVGTWRQP